MTDDERVAMVLHEAHHAYCHDTGCFDGDNIAHPEIERTIRYVLADARCEAVDRCFGQRDPDGDALLFVVRVNGIGARPDAPVKIAKALAKAWSRHYVDWPVGCTPKVTVANDLLAEAEAEREKWKP